MVLLKQVWKYSYEVIIISHVGFGFKFMDFLPGPEIKEQLVQSLRNKLDDAVLEILSVTLDRNPHCKLTPEDVLFIQKPDTPPDTVLKVRLVGGG